MGKEKVKGRRVYVTFLPDGTIAIHPSNCTGPRYRMRDEDSIHIPKSKTPTGLGKKILSVRETCKVT